ncbi:MAG: 3-phosphoshikimate 1-carboxyvinyltransferase [Bacteroidales bacterium]
MRSNIISKKDKTIKGTIRLPASKSISNRLLMIKALYGSDLKINNLSEADDTVLLQRLLATINDRSKRQAVIELDAANAGTVLRFLTAFLSITPGKWVLTGSDRMKQRPVGILADALNRLGASIDYLSKPGYPPLLIRGGGVRGKELNIESGVSSQFASALLLISPYLPEGLSLHLKGRAVSLPYIKMTTRLMEQFGAKVHQSSARIHVKPGIYLPSDVSVEADWSAAAFWYEAAVFSEDVDLELLGLAEESLQGDSVLPTIFQNFGIRTEFTGQGIRLTKTKFKNEGFYFDFTDCPDIAQAVIATCAGMGIRGRFEGVQSLQIKETNRLNALRTEIEKINVKVAFSSEGDQVSAVEIKPAKPNFSEGIVFESYGDHRTAMSMAPFAIKTGKIKILNPDVVIKSYPDYWDHLKLAGFDIQ